VRKESRNFRRRFRREKGGTRGKSGRMAAEPTGGKPGGSAAGKVRTARCCTSFRNYEKSWGGSSAGQKRRKMFKFLIRGWGESHRGTVPACGCSPGQGRQGGRIRGESSIAIWGRREKRDFTAWRNEKEKLSKKKKGEASKKRVSSSNSAPGGERGIRSQKGGDFEEETTSRGPFG